jgi:hypothetical protein
LSETWLICFLEKIFLLWLWPDSRYSFSGIVNGNSSCI